MLQVWDGLCPGRKELHATAAPKHAEYIAIVRQIQATQEAVLAMNGNSQVLPNLEAILEEAAQKLVDVDSQIKSLTPPADLVPEIEKLKRTAVEIDSRSAVAELVSQVSQVSRAIQNIQIEMEVALRNVKESVAALDNKYRNLLAQAEAAHEQQATETKAELDRLNHLLTIKDALTKI